MPPKNYQEALDKAFDRALVKFMLLAYNRYVNLYDNTQN